MRTVIAAFVATMLLLAPQAHGQGFGLFFGDEPSDLFPRFPNRVLCMTDRQIREEVASLGYRDIALNAPGERTVQVRATQGEAVYLLDFNPCSGRIERERRLR